jgi:hypothetical protein
MSCTPARVFVAFVSSWLLCAGLLSTHLVAQDAPAPTTVNDGIFTSDQAERGRKQFQIACESCHMVGEHTGKSLEGKWSGSTVGEFFDLISNTMPQSDPGGLKPQEYASILAFFLSESGYQPGAKELPADLEALKKIRIEAPSK